ncbi:STAS domain-containing protein [Actinomadura sp. 9N407]|uniref:STAS domain-containing protein n=1 Tax=Actinomadura sp. 9N407 TaxID=3375154 RepID=UPI0037AF3BF2
MTEQTVASTLDPARTGGVRLQGWKDSGFAMEGVRVRSALLRLDGAFAPPHLVVDGEVDISTLAAFTDALSSMLEHGSGDVWVDVERLSFIDVGGLRALAGAACRLGLQERRLVLRSVAPHLIRLMDLVGWSQISNLLLLPRAETSAAGRNGPGWG